MRPFVAASALIAAAALAAGCNEAEPTGPLVAGGQAYLAQCAVCHGAHGAGDGPQASSILAEGETRPARLDDIVRIGDLGREGVRLAIEGREHARRRSPMPVWGPHLGATWMDRIAGYVATLPGASPAQRAAVEHYLESPPGVPAGARRTFVLYCSGCHGARGQGDGFYSEKVEQRLHPRPLDGALFAELSDEQLEQRLGMEGPHAGEAATMPGWMHTIAPAERRALVAYLRTLSGGAGSPP